MCVCVYKGKNVYVKGRSILRVICARRLLYVTTGSCSHGNSCGARCPANRAQILYSLHMRVSRREREIQWPILRKGESKKKI